MRLDKTNVYSSCLIYRGICYIMAMMGVWMQSTRGLSVLLGSTSPSKSQTPQPPPSSTCLDGPAIRVDPVVLSSFIVTTLDLVAGQDIVIAYDPPRVDTSDDLVPRIPKGLTADAPPPLARNDHKPWACRRQANGEAWRRDGRRWGTDRKCSAERTLLREVMVSTSAGAQRRTRGRRCRRF